MRLHGSHPFLRAIVLLLLLALPGRVDAAELPAAIQAALQRKILAFDRAASGRTLRIVVVHRDDATKAHASELARELDKLGVSTQVVTPALLKQVKEAPVAVYLVSNAPVPEVEEYCVQNRVLSFASDASLVKSGRLTVALSIKDGRPEIILHLERARREGRDFSSDLLSLATVIR